MTISAQYGTHISINKRYRKNTISRQEVMGFFVEFFMFYKKKYSLPFFPAHPYFLKKVGVSTLVLKFKEKIMEHLVRKVKVYVRLRNKLIFRFFDYVIFPRIFILLIQGRNSAAEFRRGFFL